MNLRPRPMGRRESLESVVANAANTVFRLDKAGKWGEATGRLPRVLPPPDLVRELRHHVEEVSHDPEVDQGEDRRVGVLVDRDDGLGRLHPRPVLDGPGDADGDVELR